MNEAFDGRETIAEIDPRGEIVALHVAPKTPAMFANLVQAFFAETQVRLGEPGESRWSAKEENQIGTAATAYVLEGREKDGFSIAKSWSSYDALKAVNEKQLKGAATREIAGKAEVKIAPEGHVSRFSSKEKIEIVAADVGPLLSVDTTVSMSLKSIGRFDEPRKLEEALAGFATRGLGEVVVSEDALSRGREQRIGDMTAKKMVADMLAFADSGQMPNHSKWLWQVTGLLESHPEECAKLKDVFLSPEIRTMTGEKSVMNLLALVNAPEAQKVMREILMTERAQNSPGYYRIVQQFTLVEKPDAETGRLIHEEFLKRSRLQGEANEDAAYATALALGAIADKLEDPKSKEEYNAALVEKLKSVNEPMNEAQYLGALGNAGVGSNVDLISEYAQSADERVRSAALRSLRKTQSEKAEKLVMSGLQDQSADVQGAAISTLRDFQTRPEHWREVTSRVQTEVLKDETLANLANVVMSKLREGRDEKELLDLLRAIEKRNIAGPLRARILGLVGDAE